MKVLKTDNQQNKRKDQDNEARLQACVENENKKLKKQQTGCVHAWKMLENIEKKHYNKFLKRLSFLNQRGAKCSKTLMKLWRKRLREGFLKLIQHNSIIKVNCHFQKEEYLQNGISQDEKGLAKQDRISSIKKLICDFSKVQEIQRVGQKSLKELLVTLIFEKSEVNPTRMITQLKIRNKLLELENQIFAHTLEEMNKRQNKQNFKKKESLQMLAEQIQQKNQQIFALKKTVRAYKQTYENQSNVLETEAVSLRKEVDHLQNVRDKLHIQVDKYKDQLANLQSQIEKMQKMISGLELQNMQMKNKAMQSERKFLEIDYKSRQFDEFINKIQNKLKRLSVYEKKSIEDIETETNINNVREETKSQYMIFYLKNLQFKLKQLEIPSIFTTEQIQILNNHRLLWSKYISRQKEPRDPLNNERIANQQFQLSDLELSGIEGKGMMASVFHALGKQQDRDYQKRQRKRSINSKNGWQKQKQERNNENQNSNNNGRSRGEQKNPSLTIKMLQLELERNRQIEKIQELKQKFLHIRVIILNFLRSLQLQQGGKKQVMDILRLLFDLFEYSEEQRQSIFSKKKKFFSLF